MQVGEAEAKIMAVEKSLRDTPRTPYEVENLYQTNCERIAAARALLHDMGGPRVEQLRVRCNEAARLAEAKRVAGVAAAVGGDGAFDANFDMDDGEEENEAEMAKAALESRRPKKEKPKKKKDGEDRHKKKEKRTLADEPAIAPHPAPGGGDDIADDKDLPPQAWVVVSRDDDLASTEVPVALTTSGRGCCEAVSGTPLARLHFTADMDWDGGACRCAVELYRCVVIARCYGEPQLSWAECATRLAAQASAATESQGGPDHGSSAAAAASGARASDSGRDGEEEDEDDDGGDMTLSEQLVAEYDQAQQAEEEMEADTSALPREVGERLQQRLRDFSNDVWVILLCHGGYFAGGVVTRGVWVAHKAFQRYVVRKKQGGKQSSNAKDVGSYNSVGSQIRAAQEVKWRVEVRDILLEWTPYIQAASFVLYAAPGPQNRAVLTDFSLLPAVAAVGGSKCVSPIVLKDPRVCRVPLTTHRPTFEEVKRVYGVCSRCSVLYLRPDGV